MMIWLTVLIASRDPGFSAFALLTTVLAPRVTGSIQSWRYARRRR
jgi:hypothetical protein